jgi:hypothetical protein
LLEVKKRYTKIIAIVLACTLPIAIVYSLMQVSVTIPTSGTISNDYMVYAASGSRSDIQTAVNQANAEGGGTVVIPNGTFTFSGTVNSVGGVNFKGVASPPIENDPKKQCGTQYTILQLSSPSSPMFYIDGSNGKSVRIEGITFKGISGSSSEIDGLVLASVRNFVVTNCKFEYLNDEAISCNQIATSQPMSYGVIYRNSFVNLYSSAALSAGNGYAYGVGVYGVLPWIGTTPWVADFSTLWGKSDQTCFIEDNYFTGCRHCVADSCGARYVFRYNYIEKHAVVNDGGHWMVDVHPVRTSDVVMLSGNWAEVYGNILVGNQAGGQVHGITIDGGGAFVYNNTYDNTQGGSGMYYAYGTDMSTSSGTSSGNLQKCKPWIYFWNNQGTSSCVELHYVSTGGIPIRQGYEYFYYNPANDGINYTPYTYPHPLRNGS